MGESLSQQLPENNEQKPEITTNYQEKIDKATELMKKLEVAAPIEQLDNQNDHNVTAIGKIITPEGSDNKMQMSATPQWYEEKKDKPKVGAGSPPLPPDDGDNGNTDNNIIAPKDYAPDNAAMSELMNIASNNAKNMISNNKNNPEL